MDVNVDAFDVVEGLHGSAITGSRTRTTVSGVVRRNQVPTLRRYTWLRSTTPDTVVRVRFPVMALPCNPSIGYGPFAYDAGL
jgi:hypothetical protein